MKIASLRNLLKRECGDNRTAWALRNHLSPSYVTGVISGRMAPGKKILDALGFRREVRYVKIEKTANPGDSE